MSRTLLAGLLGAGLLACARADAREPEPGDDGSWTREHRLLDRSLAAGTLVEATSRDFPARRRRNPGDTLSATVTTDVRNTSRWVVIPAGSLVGLRIASVGPPPATDRADATLRLEVTSVTVAGQAYPVRASAEASPVAAAPRGGGGTRILFVLVEGFTAWRSRGHTPASK